MTQMNCVSFVIWLCLTIKISALKLCQCVCNHKHDNSSRSESGICYKRKVNYLMFDKHERKIQIKSCSVAAAKRKTDSWQRRRKNFQRIADCVDAYINKLIISLPSHGLIWLHTVCSINWMCCVDAFFCVLPFSTRQCHSFRMQSCNPQLFIHN